MLTKRPTNSQKSADLIGGLSPLSVARMLWKRKLLILGVWAVFSAIAVAVVLKLPAIYSAEALILVDSQKIPEKFVSSTVNTDVQDRLATIRQQILSSSRLMKVIEDFDLYKAQRKTHFQEEILEMMRTDIDVQVEKGWTGNRPGAFRVSYKGPDAAVVAQVANRIASQYVDENLMTREVQATGTSEFIDTQLEEAKKGLDTLEAAVSAYKLKHNGELPQQENAISGTLSRLQIELQGNHDALNRAQETKLVLENTLGVAENTLTALASPEPSRPSSEGATAAAGSAPQIETRVVIKASDNLRAQLELARVRYGEEHPDVKKLKGELERAIHLEATQAAQTKPATLEPIPAAPKAPQPVRTASARPGGDPGQAMERVASLKSSIAAVTREIQLRTADQGRILNDIRVAQGRLDRLPIHEQEMAQVLRDYEMSKANYRSLLDKKFSAEMATDMERRQKSERFTILDPARVPEVPIQPKRRLLSIGGIVIGLALGLVLGVGLEVRNNVVLGEWELPPDVAILGRLPYIHPVIASTDTPENAAGHRSRSRKARWGLISSAVLSFLGMAAAGLYFLRTHF